MKLLLFVSLFLVSVAFAEDSGTSGSPVTTASVQVDCDVDSGGVCPAVNSPNRLRLGDDTTPRSTTIAPPATEGAE